jgi:hypothetical protein
MQVNAEDCKREDQEFWIGTPPKGPTYKLKFFKEYTGDKLTETILRKHGLKPNGLQNAICNNKPLLDYIQSIF